MHKYISATLCIMLLICFSCVFEDDCDKEPDLAVTIKNNSWENHAGKAGTT